MTEKSKTVSSWYASFVKGTDFDSWGQLIEAADEYDRLARDISKSTGFENRMFQDEQKKLMMKISVCLSKRSKTLQNSTSVEEITLDELKKVGEVLRNLIQGWEGPFPVRVEIPQQNQSLVGTAEDISFAQGNEGDFPRSGGEGGGSLLVRIPFEENYHRLTIRIEKLGLKDVGNYINCFFTVSVKDANCVNVAKSQDTPMSNRKEGSYILFGADVEIQKAIEKLPRGTAIFFEFKHYKPKKSSISTKCFAFMELDEIKPGPAVIELYQKPTDFHRKKLNLLTTKPLYLHVNLTIHDD